VRICDECANLCASIVNGKEPSPTAVEAIPMQLWTILKNPDVPDYNPDQANPDPDYLDYSREKLISELENYVLAWEMAGRVIGKLILALEKSGITADAVQDALTPNRKAALTRFRTSATNPTQTPGV
jgi:hypothetical protein